MSLDIGLPVSLVSRFMAVEEKTFQLIYLHCGLYLFIGFCLWVGNVQHVVGLVELELGGGNQVSGRSSC